MATALPELEETPRESSRGGGGSEFRNGRRGGGFNRHDRFRNRGQKRSFDRAFWSLMYMGLKTFIRSKVIYTYLWWFLLPVWIYCLDICWKDRHLDCSGVALLHKTASCVRLLYHCLLSLFLMLWGEVELEASWPFFYSHFCCCLFVDDYHLGTHDRQERNRIILLGLYWTTFRIFSPNCKVAVHHQNLPQWVLVQFMKEETQFVNP